MLNKIYQATSLNRINFKVKINLISKNRKIKKINKVI